MHDAANRAPFTKYICICMHCYVLCEYVCVCACVYLRTCMYVYVCACVYNVCVLVWVCLCVYILVCVVSMCLHSGEIYVFVCVSITVTNLMYVFPHQPGAHSLHQSQHHKVRYYFSVVNDMDDITMQFVIVLQESNIQHWH